MNKNLLLNINSYLLILLPAFLVTGPLLPEIVLLITFIIFLILCYSEKEFKYFNNNFFKIFLLFYLIINLSTFLNFNLLSLKSSLFYFRFGFLSLVIWHCIDKNPKFIKYFFTSLIILLIAIFLDSLIQLIFKKNILSFPISQTGRVSSFFGDELVLGSFLTRIFPLFVALIFLLNISNKKYILPVVTILFLINIFITSSRTSLAMFIFFVISFLIFLKNIRLFVIFSLITLILVSLTYSFNKTGFNRLFVHTFNQFSENNTIQIHSFRHTLHYLTAWKIFKEKPLLGYGPKSFRLNCFKKQFVPNKYIQNNNTFFTNQTAELNILIQGINYDVNGNEIIKKFYNNEVLNFLPILNNTESQKKVYDLTDNFLLFDIYKFNEINKLSSSVVTLYIKNLNSNEDKFIFKNKQNAKFYLNINAISTKENKILIQKNTKYLVNYSEYFNGCNTHPHNFHLQVLSETGLIGYFIIFSLFMYIVYALLINLFKINSKTLNLNNLSAPSIILLIGYMIILFPLFPSGNFFNNWLSISIYLPSGFLLSELYKK